MIFQSDPNPISFRPRLSLLFMICFRIGILSFGGGLSGWVHQEFVFRRQLLSEDDFASSMAIAQMLPGANVVNLVICIGEQLRGASGSIVCTSGFIVGPFFAVVGLYSVFDYLASFAQLPLFFNGVAFAAIGLLLLTCVQGARRAWNFPPFLAVIAVTALLVGVLEWPLIPVVLVIAPISIALSLWRLNDAR